MNVQKSCLMLMAGAVLAACGGSSEKKEAREVVHSVMTVRPSNPDGALVKNFSGVVKENSTTSLSFRIGGQIEHIYVKEGDYVRKGQLLATLDAKDYRLDLQNAEVQAKQMRDQVARMKLLHEGKTLTDNDWEEATAGLERLEIQLQSKQNQMTYTRLTSPVNGYVQNVNREVAEMVSAGLDVIDIVDNGRQEVEVYMPLDVARLHDRFTTAYCLYNGERYDLTLKTVLHKADANQLYTVKLAIDAPIHLGQSVDVYINVASSDHAALSLPPHAIFEREGKSCVWTVDEKETVHAKEVETGNVDQNGNVIVLNGLSASDEVVKAGASYLHEGEKVRVVTKKATNVGDLL